MQWLLIFFGGLLESLIKWFAKKGLYSLGVTISYIALYIGLYLAFVTATAGALWLLEPAMPNIVPFVLSLFPPVAFAMMNVYFVALVARRVFDWHRRSLKEMHSAMNSMNY
jgi:hypothetical protein